jgi:hypothetical protein
MKFKNKVIGSISATFISSLKIPRSSVGYPQFDLQYFSNRDGSV